MRTLDQQVTARAGEDTNLTGLSDIEKQMNHSLMKAAMEKPEVLAKVLHKGGSAPAKRSAAPM